jgi:single-stranded-DNA-specific exonuclease
MWGFAEQHVPVRNFLGVARSATERAWASRLDLRGEAVATAMAQRGIASECLARVLAGRGVGLDGAAAYLTPSLKADLPDPSSLVDMDIAAVRLADAVIAGAKVAIFGDYDVDWSDICRRAGRRTQGSRLPDADLHSRPHFRGLRS